MGDIQAAAAEVFKDIEGWLLALRGRAAVCLPDAARPASRMQPEARGRGFQDLTASLSHRLPAQCGARTMLRSDHLLP